MKQHLKQPAFTLAELLIALAILGVIATFTIPKILDSGSNSQWNAIGKEAAAMVSGAYQSYKLDNSVSGSTDFSDLLPYMNYVRIDTTSTIDSLFNETTQTCTGANIACILLHNGALIQYVTGGAGNNFGDTSVTSALWFDIDPDGKVTTTGAAGTPGKSVQMYLYINGRLNTRGTVQSNTYVGSVGPYSPDPAADPPWFSWGN